MSRDVICMSEFGLFNNIIIFVVLFRKTTKLLLSITIRVEETRQSNSSYEFSQRQNIVLRSEFRYKHWYLASISRLLKHTDSHEITRQKMWMSSNR